MASALYDILVIGRDPMIQIASPDNLYYYSEDGYVAPVLWQLVYCYSCGKFCFGEKLVSRAAATQSYPALNDGSYVFGVLMRDHNDIIEHRVSVERCLQCGSAEIETIPLASYHIMKSGQLVLAQIVGVAGSLNRLRLYDTEGIEYSEDDTKVIRSILQSRVKQLENLDST
jgi:hypothetical protein